LTSAAQDIEGAEALPKKTPTTGYANELTLLMQELRSEGNKQNPHFQISFCYAIYAGQPQLPLGWVKVQGLLKAVT
jgi:hypothetical protein